MKARYLGLIAPLGILGITGCFASQADVRVLQGDLMLIRNEAAAADAERKAQLDEILMTLSRSQDQLVRLNDSLVAVNGRLVRFRSDMAGSVSSIEQQLLQIQELTGQSQRRLQEMRTSLETRTDFVTPDPVSPGADKGATPAQPGSSGPGPNELYSIAKQQLNQGSYGAARFAFEDLIKQYPKADIVIEAQYYIADSYAAEGDAAAADSVYALVVSKFPKSSWAATALYKRGTLAQEQGKTGDAKKFLNEVIKKYPRTDEAIFAKERIESMDRKD